MPKRQSVRCLPGAFVTSHSFLVCNFVHSQIKKTNCQNCQSDNTPIKPALIFSQIIIHIFFRARHILVRLRAVQCHTKKEWAVPNFARWELVGSR